MKKIATLTLLGLFAAVSVSAQVTDQLKDSINQIRQNANLEAKDQRESAKQQLEVKKAELENQREVAKTQLEIQREEAKQLFEAKREEAKQRLEAKREELKTVLEEKREAAKAQIETKREELKAKIAKIRDEKKQEIIQRVYDQVNALNERLTTKMASSLDQIDEVLNRVRSRADKAEANGLNVSEARTAISAAETAIASSRNAVAVQAEKAYSFDVQVEATLKSDVGVARQALSTDLKALRDQVGSARDAVKDAATALAKIPRVDEAEIPESSSE